MFSLLKNKLSQFVDKLVGRESAKEEPKPKEPSSEKKEIIEPVIEKIAEKHREPIVEKKPEHIDAKEHVAEKKHEHVFEKKIAEPKPVEHKIEIKHEKTVEKKSGPKLELTHEPVIEKPKEIPILEAKKAEISEKKPGFFEKILAPLSHEKKIEPEIKKEELATAKKAEEKRHELEMRQEEASAKKAEAQKPVVEANKPEIQAHAKHKMGENVKFEKENEAKIDEKEFARIEKKALEDKDKEMKVKMGLGKTIAGFFSPTISVEEHDVQDLLDELEISLLESDVAYDVSTEVTGRLKKKLVGMKVQKSKMHEEVRGSIKQVLGEIMTPKTSFDFYSKVQATKKPAKILFVGPNGAGKTTTIAKIAKGLQERGHSVVLSASDTFRAAAIEQLEEHAKRLGVVLIKSKYGADPASVAFDALKYANAHGIEVVLIDSAGRQDTNSNLIDEMKKINRVIAPDLKIYVGESIGGNALIEQIKTFHSAIGIDGAILTKLDCDAKGGTAISLSYSTGVPILFLGVGQKYADLEVFDANRIAEQILT